MSEVMKVCNTSEYNNFLKQRGQVFRIFISAKDRWFAKGIKEKKKVGTPFVYSDDLILHMHSVRYLFKLSLREVAGLFEEMVKEFYKDSVYTVPHYSIVCRRLKALDIPIHDHRHNQNTEAVNICIDSTGINIYNTGGGHSKENACSRRYKRYDQVRKLHVALNHETGNVEQLTMTSGTKADHITGTALIEQLPNTVQKIYADRAYDRKSVRKACAKKNILQVIPATRPAVIRKPRHNDPPNLFDDRNEMISLRRQHAKDKDADLVWKQKHQYGNRAHVEGFFSRFKRKFGFHFVSKSEINRAQELKIKTKILNDFNQLGRAQYKYKKVA